MMKRTILLSLAALCCALTAAAQDLIVKTDAAKIEAKVIEITPEAVRYKRFSNPDGPTYVLPVAQIHYIQYANGEKEYYTKTILPFVHKARRLDLRLLCDLLGDFCLTFPSIRAIFSLTEHPEY